MDIGLNTETLQQCCRCCLQKGDINIWNFKVKINRENYESLQHMAVSMDLSILQLMNIFNNDKHQILDLTEEFPLFCCQCLEDLKFCYLFYEKLKLANIQLKKLYNETLNQCMEEEHLIEPIEEDKTNLIEMIETQSIDKCKEPQRQTVAVITPQTEEFQTLTIKPIEKSKPTNDYSKKVPFDKNSAFIITQFIPTTLEKSQISYPNQFKLQEGEKEYEPPPQHLLTMDYKVVEIKDIENLESHAILSTEDKGEPAIYICQHCPQAFTKSEYLKTHIENSHVCKFCTQSFSVSEDLFKHIREVHTEHKCVICLKNFSSNTNLRQHIRRVHRIKLPAKMALIDYIKPTDIVVENPQNVSEMEILQTEKVETNFEENIQYLLKNDDCIEMINETNMELK